MHKTVGLIISALIIAAALVYQGYVGVSRFGTGPLRYEMDAAEDGRVVWVLDRLRGTLDGCAVQSNGEVVCAADDRSHRADDFAHVIDPSKGSKSLRLRRLDDGMGDGRRLPGGYRSPYHCFMDGQMKVCRLRALG